MSTEQQVNRVCLDTMLWYTKKIEPARTILRTFNTIVWPVFWVWLPLSAYALFIYGHFIFQHPEMIWKMNPDGDWSFQSIENLAAAEGMAKTSLFLMLGSLGLIWLKRWAIYGFGLMIAYEIFQLFNKELSMIFGSWEISSIVAAHHVLVTFSYFSLLMLFQAAVANGLKLEQEVRKNRLLPIAKFSRILANFRASTWMPVQVRLVEARYRPFVIGLLGVSAICYSIFPLIFQTMLHRFYSDAFAIYRDCLAGYDMLDCVRRGRERNFYLTLVVAPALVLAGLALARLLAARGQKWITFSLSHLVRKDKRKPILFLRSFRDDQVLMPRAKYSLTGTLAEFGRPSLSLDEMLYNKASRHGPVVAIGRPGDTLQPYGAAREYISDETWKMRVADLSRDASTIIACADNTEGTIWELRHVLQAPSAHKTMVLFHPRLYAGNERSILTSKLQTFEEIDGAVRVCLRDLSKDAVGFFSTPERAVIEITSAEWSNLAYNAALDLFLFRQLTSSESV